MWNRRKFLFLLTGILLCGGCADGTKQQKSWEAGKAGASQVLESLQVFPVSAHKALAPVNSASENPVLENILNAFSIKTGKPESEWKVGMTKETAGVTAALILPKDMPQILGDDYVRLVPDLKEEQYLVFYCQEDGTLLGAPIRERGISQLCFWEDKTKLYVGMIYQTSFAGWEDYSMKWLCYEDGGIKRVWNELEDGNPYQYWKDRKAVFGGDRTISIFARQAAAGALETLMQERELRADGRYTDYVPEYQWVAENEISVEQWLAGGVVRNANIPSAPELISMLFEVDGEKILPAPIYFSTGFEGAVVELHTVRDNSPDREQNGSGTVYFIVKKYSTSHSAGFQSLYIGSMDTDTGKIVQCVAHPGDHSQAAVVLRDGGQYILFYTESISNGLPTTVGGILKAEGGGMSCVWPDTAEGADILECEGYWHPCACGREAEGKTEVDKDAMNAMPVHRTARLEDGKLIIYRIDFCFDQDSGMVEGYDLVPEEEIAP